MLEGGFLVNGGCGTYYYTVSYVGTAIGSMSVTGGEVSAQTGTTAPSGPTAGRITGEPLGEGGIIKAQFGPQNGMLVDMLSPAELGAGTFTDTITISACYDAACSQPVPGSPQSVTISYVITGNPIPNTLFTPSPGMLLLEAPTSGATPTATVAIQTDGLPPSGAYVFTSAGTGAAIASTTFNSNQNGTGTLTMTAMAPAVLGPGLYSDSLQITICFDSACNKPAAGSPYIVPVTYIVDASSGVDFTQQTIPLTIFSMAWNPSTQLIYASVPGYDATHPNSLVAINPATATIQTVLKLGQSTEYMALSPDGSYAYVYDSVANQVARVNLASMAVDATIPMPQFTSVTALAVAPGAPTTLAATTYNDYSTVTIYNGTTALAQTLASSNLETNILLSWGTDASTLYAFNPGLTGAPDTLYQMNASTSGLTVGNSWTVTPANLTPNGLIEIMAIQFAGSAIYFNSGDVVSATTGQAQPGFAMQVTNGGGITTSGFVIDTTLNRGYFVTSDAALGQTGQLTLQGFNLSTQQSTWIARFPTTVINTPLIRWGTNGLAFATTVSGLGNLVLISGPVVAR